MNVLLALQGLELIKKALDDWGYENNEGCLYYIQGITDLIDVFNKELRERQT